MKSLNTFQDVLTFNQDIWKHTRKITSLFDWAGNSNLIGSVALDNKMLLYDIRLSKPVLNKFINAPFQNCLKTYDNKLVIAPKESNSLIEVFDMRKFDQVYSIMVNKCITEDSEKFIVQEMTSKFDDSDVPFNFRFEKSSLKNKINSTRESKFLNLVVGISKKY
jgi:hypothetical protein